MSFTACYSQLYAFRDNKIVSSSPRILDFKKFEKNYFSELLIEDYDEEDIKDITIISEETDYSSYPEKKWKVVKGFKTWKLDEEDLDIDEGKENLLGLKFNIERFGLAYGTDKEDFLSFFAKLSKYTEPFVVFHSPIEYQFPEVYDYILDEEIKKDFWMVKAQNGKAKIIKFLIEVKENKE